MEPTPTVEPTPRQQLADAVKRRRLALGINKQQALGAAGGMNPATWNRVEDPKPDDQGDLTEETLAKVDAALQWMPGSAYGLYKRGEPPTPLAREVTDPEGGRLHLFEMWPQGRPDAYLLVTLLRDPILTDDDIRELTAAGLALWEERRKQAENDQPPTE